MEKLFEVQRDRFYQVHTYKHTTMGFIQDIENMPNEYEYSKAGPRVRCVLADQVRRREAGYAARRGQDCRRRRPQAESDS